MPQRRRRRFEKLHDELKATNFTATAGAPGEYFNYLKGINKLTYPRKAPGQFLKTFNVGVTPFSLEPNTGTGAITAFETSITVQADNIRNIFNTVLTDALLGIQRDLTKCIVVDNFYAADCVLSIIPTSVLSTAKTSTPSSITKEPYKRYIGIRSGSIPYGRSIAVPAAVTEGGTPTTPTIATETEEDSRKSIVAAIPKGLAAGDYTIYSVHFVPEEIVESRSFGKSKPTAAPTGLPTG